VKPPFDPFNNMVSQSLQKHGSDIVYLQKTKPCIRKYLIAKADRSLVDCLCECTNNSLRGKVPLTKLQKESSERPCYFLSVWCKSDKKRDVTSFLWLDIHFLFLTGKDEGS
jgi:hypothetical protein